ncbi:major facilitator superfamily domain-containing protein, partial [Protomyces lactucae-debilis]
DDPRNPQNFSSGKKWLLTLILLSGSSCVACDSSIYTSTYAQIIPEFGTNQNVATLGLTLFIFGLGIGPLFLAPLSEFYGRRPIYLISFGLFFVWQIPCAFAQNIETMLIVRFLAGLSSSPGLSIAGGSVSDCFEGRALAFPMALYSASPFLGPVIGPLVGGYINQYTHWRWTFYVMMVWTFLLWLGIIFFVPETFAPALLVKIARERRAAGENVQAPLEVSDKTIPQTILTNLKRPFILLIEPIVLLLNTWTSVLLAILYLFFGAFPIVFREEHNFTQAQIGLSFLGILVGIGLGVLTIPTYWTNQQSKLFAKHGNKPEIMLLPAMLGSILGPLGLLLFAFTLRSNYHWSAPIISTIPFGMAVILVFSSVFAFLVRAYTPWAASALASNSVERSLLAGIFPLFGRQLYENLGNMWASALLAFIVLAMLPLPFLFYVKGEKIRAKS